MALLFPANPDVGDPYPYTTPDGIVIIYVWDGDKWVAQLDSSNLIDEGLFVKKAGDNMEGDLTFDTDKMVLTNSGNVSLTGYVSTSKGGGTEGVCFQVRNELDSVDDGLNTRFRVFTDGAVIVSGDNRNNAKIALNADGYGKFAGGDIKLNADGSATFANYANAAFYIADYKSSIGINANNYTLFKGQNGTEVVAAINADGSATFAGDVSFGCPDFSSGNQSFKVITGKNSAVEFDLGAYTTSNGTPGTFYDKTGNAPFLYKAKGTSKLAITNDGDVRIGGDVEEEGLPNPNISLKADGSASFAGNVTCVGGFNSNNLSVEGTAAPGAGLFIVKPGTTSDFAAKIINDGSATFVTDKVYINANTSGLGGHVEAVSSRDTDPCFIANLSGTQTALINADGSAIFTGNVSLNRKTSQLYIGERTSYQYVDYEGKLNFIEQIPYNSTNEIKAFEIGASNSDSVDNGAYHRYGVKYVNPNRLILTGLKRNSSTYDDLITMVKNDITFSGSATFAGSVVSSSTGSTSLNMGLGGVLLGDYGALQAIRPADTASPSTTDVFTSGYGANQTCKIFADGSATFAGLAYSSTGYQARNELNSTDAGHFLWKGNNHANQETSRIDADGTAVFVGTVTANGTILSRASGDINVGDRLDATKTALEAIKTAAEDNSTDLAGLKAAIVSALANI